MSSDRPPNRLANETSPYLQQHAHNPVDWYPWGEEALEKAQREDKPLLVSIGYSACHWCHVMERESFEDDEVAALLNDHFVPIKVDREERPDLDHIYMTAVQLLTQQGGWPLNMFCTPAGEPFYGGTYFPPQDQMLPDGRLAMPGFKRVLLSVAELYRSRRGEIDEHVRALAEGMAKVNDFVPTDNAPSTEWLERAAESVVGAVDMRHGGVGSAPKFPNPMLFQLLLRASAVTGRARYLDAVTLTLEKMASGGIYDHLAGAFARYSTDERWLVPHFEKMLYDQAQLVELYVDAYRATGRDDFRRVIEETVGFVLRDLTDPSGGFYSTLDADSEGEEGKYYVWTLAEVEEVLGPDDARVFGRVYDITADGNWEGRCIPQRLLTDDVAARYFERPVEVLRDDLARMRAKLLEARRERVAPGRDEKILTAWNGLMLSAVARAGAVLGRSDWLEAARTNADFVQSHLATQDGRLLRSYKDGRARFQGYLDDHAFFARGLLDLFEATFEARWLDRARQLGEVLLTHFEDGAGGGFHFTAHDHEQLVARTKSAYDSAIPSGNAIAVEVLARLHVLTEDARYAEAADRAIRLFSDGLERQPIGFATLLGALDLRLRGATEIVLVGELEAPETQQLLARVRAAYVPNAVVYVADPKAGASAVPFAADRPGVSEGTAVYVCRNRTCSAPVTTWDALEPLLRPDA